MPPKMPQDRPKTAPRGSWRAYFSLLKIVLNFDSFWIPFWSILASKMEPKQTCSKIFEGIFGRSKMLFIFVLFWIAAKTAQEGPRGTKEAPRKTSRAPQRGPKKVPKVPQEAPREPQETPRAGQESSRPSNIAPTGFKRHRRLLRSPKST